MPMAQKTLFLFEQPPDQDSFFFEREGDYSRFNDIYVNTVPPKAKAERARVEALQKELNDFIFDAKGQFLVTDAEKLAEPSKDWTWFVKCGFVG